MVLTCDVFLFQHIGTIFIHAMSIIYLASVDADQVRLHVKRRKIGIVQQDPVLFIGSIKENIAYGYEEASENDVEDAAKLANAHDFIEKFPEKYNTQVGERGIQLSGGQKQVSGVPVRM